MLSNPPRGLKTAPDFASDPSIEPIAHRRARSARPLPCLSDLQEEIMFDYFHFPGRTSIHERKLAAWALFVGERGRMVSSRDRSSRPHCGMLPDVDPATAAPDPGRRSIFRCLVDFVRTIGGPVEALEIAPAASLSGRP